MKRSVILACAGLVFILASYIPWPTTTPQTSDVVAEAVYDEVAYGEALFLAKGCVTCHEHSGLDRETGRIPIGPNLGLYEPNPEFVREWLRDPAAIRPGTMMPNLELSESEIDALIAFLAHHDETSPQQNGVGGE